MEATVIPHQSREETLVGFMAGYGITAPDDYLREHLIEMGFTPKARPRDEMRDLVAAGFVVRVRNKGYAFTRTGRAWAALKYGYDWLIGDSQ